MASDQRQRLLTYLKRDWLAAALACTALLVTVLHYAYIFSAFGTSAGLRAVNLAPNKYLFIILFPFAAFAVGIGARFCFSFAGLPKRRTLVGFGTLLAGLSMLGTVLIAAGDDAGIDRAPAPDFQTASVGAEYMIEAVANDPDAKSLSLKLSAISGMVRSQEFVQTKGNLARVIEEQFAARQIAFKDRSNEEVRGHLVTYYLGVFAANPPQLFPRCLDLIENFFEGVTALLLIVLAVWTGYLAPTGRKLPPPLRDAATNLAAAVFFFMLWPLLNHARIVWFKSFDGNFISKPAFIGAPLYLAAIVALIAVVLDRSTKTIVTASAAVVAAVVTGYASMNPSVVQSLRLYTISDLIFIILTAVICCGAFLALLLKPSPPEPELARARAADRSSEG